VTTDAGPSPEVAQESGSLWRDQAFRRFWYRQGVSEAGSQITQIALPLMAVVSLQASPFAVGLLSASRYLPFILLSVAVGALADRTHHKPLLIGADIGRAVAVGVIPILWLAGWLTLPLLVLLAFVSGSLRVLFDVTYQAFMPQLISREKLLAANSILEGTSSVARVAGPGLAGWLVAAVGAPLAMAADALSFAFSALTLVRVKPSHGVLVDRSVAPTADLLAGFRVVSSHPLLRSMLISSSLANLALMLIQAVVYVFLYRQMHFGAGVIGGIMAVSGLGAVVGNSLSAASGRRFGVRPTMVGGFALVVGGSAVLAAANGPRLLFLAAFGVGYFAYGLGTGLFNVHSIAYRQRVASPELLGRLTGTFRMVLFGSLAAGALLGGTIAQVSDARSALAAGAVVNAIAMVALTFGIRSAGAEEDDR
jgi:MFS family permease